MGSGAKSYMRKGFPHMRRCANISPSPYMGRPLVIYNFAPDPSEFPEFPYIWEKFYFLFHQCTVPSSIRHESISDSYYIQKRKSWCTNKGGSSICMKFSAFACFTLLYLVAPHPLPPPPCSAEWECNSEKIRQVYKHTVRCDFQSPYNFGAAILVASAILALRILLYHSAVAYKLRYRLKGLWHRPWIACKTDLV
jgi:hypothetical protein